MPLRISQWLTQLYTAFLPRLCLICNHLLLPSEKGICARCRLYFAPTLLHRQTKPLLERLFQYFPFVKGVTVLWYYHDSPLLQQVLYRMKYGQNPYLGLYLGRFLGESIALHYQWEIAAILPMPIHPRRLRQRGFNQCEWIARGIRTTLPNKPPILSHIVQRTRFRGPMSRLAVHQRLHASIGFRLTVPKQILRLYRSVLIVDDVITTGTTISSLLAYLESVFDRDLPSMEIYIGGLAWAKRGKG